MDIGVVAQAQLKRVYPKTIRQLVEGRLERDVAFALSRGTHKSRAGNVQPDLSVAGRHVRARVRRRCPHRDGVRDSILYRSGGDGHMIDRNQLAVTARTDLDMLHRIGTVANRG